MYTRKPAVPNTSHGPAKSINWAPLKSKMATLGGLPLPDWVGINVIPQFGHFPGLSKINLSHGNPQGGHTYPSRDTAAFPAACCSKEGENSALVGGIVAPIPKSADFLGGLDDSYWFPIEMLRVTIPALSRWSKDFGRELALIRHGARFEDVAPALGNTVAVVAKFYSHEWAKVRQTHTDAGR